MAFVCVSQRKITEKSEKDTYPSPAHYTLQTSHLSHQCAPFRSTSVRKIQFQQSQSKEFPGPGQYNVAIPFITPKVSTYFCQNNVLFKINSQGSSPFISQTKRFNKSLTNVPGPASYEIANQAHFKGVRQIPKRRKKKQHAIAQTIPSKARELLSLLEAKQQKFQKNSPGPGSYYYQRKKMVNSKGTVWAKDKVNRFNSIQPSDLGPGKYSIDNTKVKKHIQEKSSIFKSNTVRTFLDSLVYGSQVQNIVNYRKQNNFKSPLPAPGQYNTSLSVFKHNYIKPIKYQFFGSSTQRFPENSANDPQKTTTFPKTETISERVKSRINKLPFNSKTQRDVAFLNLKNEEQVTPGPGYYMLPNNTKGKKKEKGKQIEQFGSTSARKPFQSNAQEIVGPGHYHLQQENTIGMNRIGLIKEQSPVFKSKTKRNFSEQNPILPQIGEYDLTYNDVSKKLQRQKLHLENLKRINVYKPPFESGNSRFPHYQQWILDEQIHNPELKQEKAKKIPENMNTIKQVPGAIFTKQSRFQESRKGEGCPGVGSYQVIQKWNLKSYNTRFHKA